MAQGNFSSSARPCGHKRMATTDIGVDLERQPDVHGPSVVGKAVVGPVVSASSSLGSGEITAPQEARGSMFRLLSPYDPLLQPLGQTFDGVDNATRAVVLILVATAMAANFAVNFFGY